MHNDEAFRAILFQPYGLGEGPNFPSLTVTTGDHFGPKTLGMFPAQRLRHPIHPLPLTLPEN